MAQKQKLCKAGRFNSVVYELELKDFGVRIEMYLMGLTKLQFIKKC